MDNGASSYRRYLDGDNDSFVEIVREYKDGLILYINSFVDNIYIAEDLTEDTFVKLGIKKPKYHQKASFKTWLYTIARHVAIDYVRKNKKSNEIPLDDYEKFIKDKTDIEKSYIREERKRIVHQVMNQLKPEYRQVLWLIYFEEFKYKEVAKIMKKSVHNIETLAYRARLSLKSELEKEGFVYEDL